MDELDAGQRQVVALRYLADPSLEEIARRLDLPVGTVKFQAQCSALALIWNGMPNLSVREA